MRTFFFILTALLISLAWLSPYHDFPWLTFSSEMLSFAALISLVFALSDRPLQVPRLQCMGLPIIIIPLVQWLCSIILDFSTALLSSIYLFAFWMTVITSYNLAVHGDIKKIFSTLSVVVLIVSSISASIAFVQWLGWDQHVYGVMPLRNSNRPFSNFAQPNNLSTFLVMGLMACLYLFEQQKLKRGLLIVVAALLLFAIALTQSRTAWVMCVFFLLYWTYNCQQESTRLRTSHSVGWMAYFVTVILTLPYLTALLAHSGMTQVIETVPVVERATTGYLRLDIWSQMLLAIQQKPLLGFGWGQVSLAQLSVFDLHPSQEWITSGHNILLDILVWNGLPCGLFIIFYMVYWIISLHQKAKSLEVTIALLMVGAILIHALLEFPLRYAYFLLPFGFLLGFIQAHTTNRITFSISNHLSKIIVGLSCVLMLLIWRDYTVYKLNHSAALKRLPMTQTVWGSSDIYLLTQLKHRIEWLQLDPTLEIEDEKLIELEKLVKNRASPYNLYKYAQLLLANKRESEAEHYLFYLNTLYHRQYTLQDLRAKTQP